MDVISAMTLLRNSDPRSEINLDAQPNLRKTSCHKNLATSAAVPFGIGFKTTNLVKVSTAMIM
jgi:hypothetical protein